MLQNENEKYLLKFVRESAIERKSKELVIVLHFFDNA